MNEVFKLIENYGVVPVVKIEDVEHALPLAKALCDGELEVAEVTYRTEHAAEAIKLMTENYPEMLIGAGTVTTAEQVKEAVEAGAKFIVSPCYVEEVVSYCSENDIPVIPSCNTPSEVQLAVDKGLKVLKYFPAEASGGVDFINSIAAVFPGVKFMPTGGINPTNITKYLRSPNVIACGGSWMVKPELMKEGKFDEIRKLARDAVFAVLNFDFAHFGINCDTKEEGYENIFKLADMFDLSLGNTPSSTYVGKDVEITKQPFKVRGPHGHIGYHTDNIQRAIFYFEKKGIEFNHESVKPYNGKVYVIYLKELIAGFAIHIEERNDHNPPKWEHRDDVKEFAKKELSGEIDFTYN